MMQNIYQYINVFLTVISISIAVVSIYYRTKSNFVDLIIKYIKEAEEDTELSGSEKMNLVISWIKNVIPRLFKVMFTDDVLRKIAQNIYDDMKEYRDTYIKNRTGLSTEDLLKTMNK